MKAVAAQSRAAVRLSLHSAQVPQWVRDAAVGYARAVAWVEPDDDGTYALLDDQGGLIEVVWQEPPQATRQGKGPAFLGWTGILLVAFAAWAWPWPMFALLVLIYAALHWRVVLAALGLNAAI